LTTIGFCFKIDNWGHSKNNNGTLRSPTNEKCDSVNGELHSTAPRIKSDLGKSNTHYACFDTLQTFTASEVSRQADAHTLQNWVVLFLDTYNYQTSSFIVFHHSPLFDPQGIVTTKSKTRYCSLETNLPSFLQYNATTRSTIETV